MNETTLAYCPELPQVVERLRALHQERRMDLVLASLEVPNAAMAEFAATHREGYCAPPDPAERIAFWDRVLAEHTPLSDDALPNVYLTEMDQGLYGGLVGGHAQFMCDPQTAWISSMVEPLLRNLGEFAGLSFRREGDWWQRYLHELEVFVAGAAGKFGVSHFILINGLNFIFELVGATRTYLALIEEPALVRRALELAYEVNLAVQQEFFAHAPQVLGGTASFMCQWLPGRVISESVDPFHMTSVDYFEEWGRPTLERIFGQFDGGVLHIHGNGRHLLEAVSTVRGLQAVWLGDDRGFPRAWEVVGELRARVGDLPLHLQVPYADFAPALADKRLVGGVFYRVTGVPDLATAQRTMEHVRDWEG